MPRLTNTFANICDPTETEVTITGFALIRLVSPVEGVDSVYHAATGKTIPVNDCAQEVRADIDQTTGAWVSCELPCNDELTPAGSYYEVVEWINGACCDPTLLVQFDCANNTYPDPVPLQDVAINAPGATANTFICDLVSSCLAAGTFEFQVTDTDSTNLTIAGTGPSSDPWILQSDLIVDTNTDNVLAVSATGVFVEAFASTPVASDSSSRRAR